MKCFAEMNFTEFSEFSQLQENQTRKHSSSRRTTCLPTVCVAVTTTRYQYWVGIQGPRSRGMGIQTYTPVHPLLLVYLPHGMPTLFVYPPTGIAPLEGTWDQAYPLPPSPPKQKHYFVCGQYKRVLGLIII